MESEQVCFAFAMFSNYFTFELFRFGLFHLSLFIYRTIRFNLSLVSFTDRRQLSAAFSETKRAGGAVTPLCGFTSPRLLPPRNEQTVVVFFGFLE